jgi:hypothetical protein
MRILCVFNVKKKEGLLRQQRWTISFPTAGTENSSGTERTGSPFVKVVTVRRPLKKMAALEIFRKD